MRWKIEIVLTEVNDKTRPILAQVVDKQSHFRG
jgi:hypothetical protein